MCRRQQIWNGFLCAAIELLLCCAGVVRAQTTAFTYQGKLTDAGNPANGNYDLQFQLFDSLMGGGRNDNLIGGAGDDSLWGDAGAVATTSAGYLQAQFHGGNIKSRWTRVTLGVRLHALPMNSMRQEFSGLGL